MPWWGWTAIGFLALVALLYWLLILTEGIYLGPRVVVWLYDRFAPRYDGVKAFECEEEAHFLGQPLARLQHDLQRDPVILDVATGTGRLPLAAARATGGRCTIVALDRSAGMLEQARAKLSCMDDGRMTFVQHDAVPLPFADDFFDAVTCLEALEFFPKPMASLHEMLRVLRPGGLFLVSNRVGWQARLMPGRTMRRERFRELLRTLTGSPVVVQPWQVDYDLALARKGFGYTGQIAQKLFERTSEVSANRLKATKPAREPAV